MGLIVHCGAARCTLQDLIDVPTPPPTETWHPLGHADYIHMVWDSFSRYGYRVTDAGYAMHAAGNKMFGLFTLQNGVDPLSAYRLTVGIRNAIDKSLAAGFAAGGLVTVCDNLVFHGDIVIARKHTSNILIDLPEMIDNAVAQLAVDTVMMEARYDAYKAYQISHTTAHDAIVNMMRADIINSTMVKHVVAEWHMPSYRDHLAYGQSVWRLLMAVTQIHKTNQRGWQRDNIMRSVQMSNLLDDLAGFDTGAVVETVPEPSHFTPTIVRG